MAILVYAASVMLGDVDGAERHLSQLGTILQETPQTTEFIWIFSGSMTYCESACGTGKLRNRLIEMMEQADAPGRGT